MKITTFKLLSLILFTIIIFMGIMPIITTSNAVTNLKPGEITTDLSRIDRELYPGIVERVYALKKKYPKWEFEFYKTGLDWDRFIALQHSPDKSSSPHSLVYDTFKGTWICEYRGTKKYDSGRWYAASYQAVEFTADPRSYLNEYDIFSLKRVSDKKNALSKADSLVIIKGALQGRSYLKQADVIYNVATSENVDFVDVVARLIQEQGNGTVLTDGSKSVDPKDKKLYYNPYNVGATGGTKEQVVANGIARAKKEGWDSFEKGLRGGIQLVKTNYAKQNTSYFEKFNATESDYSGRFHQYMQNITAPFSEGEFKKELYQNVDPYLTESSYTFVVPLYENMQKAATDSPNHFLATPKGKKYTAPTDPILPAFANLAISGLNLRTGPGTNYASLGEYNKNTVIKVLEKKANNWYYVEIDSNGKKGYMAKIDPNDKEECFIFQFKQNPTMFGKTNEHRHVENQNDPTIPRRALTNYSLTVRKTPSISGESAGTLPFKSLISVRERVADANGYEWYKILYSYTKDESGFFKNGYIARNEIGELDHYFAYLTIKDATIIEELEPFDPTKESELINQKNPKLPAFAILKSATDVKRGSGSLSSKTIRKLPKNSRIKVREKVANKDGYEWYQIYYNWNGKNFDNTGYIARNKIKSATYSFRYVVNPDWEKCAFLLSLNNSNTGDNSGSGTGSGSDTGSGSGSGSSTTTPTTTNKTAKTTTTLNVRRGSGSLSAPIIKTIPANSTIQIREQKPNKDGYTWYLIYYNPVNGKYQNSGYISRNAVGSKSYYFNYITSSTGSGSGSGSGSTTPTPTTNKIAKTTTTLNVRRGSGSLSAPIKKTIPANSTIKIREQKPNKDGYTWYLIYYNPVNGKYQNSGYVSRNAVGSKSYYFNYI